MSAQWQLMWKRTGKRAPRAPQARLLRTHCACCGHVTDKDRGSHDEAQRAMKDLVSMLFRMLPIGSCKKLKSGVWRAKVPAGIVHIWIQEVKS